MSDTDRTFATYDAENPRIWELFERFTFVLIRRGFQNYSADAVLHRVRWETAVEAQDGEFKINNNYSAHYARKWRERYPEYADFFRTRQLKNLRRAA